MSVKFLIIRFSSIGDIVLTTPVIRCLKRQVEEAEVHFLVKKQFQEVVSANPYIDSIHLFEGNLRQTIRNLRKENYHYIIDLHHSLRSAIIKRRTDALSFTFRKLNFRKWLLVRFHLNLLPDLHIVDRYLETVALFDVVNDGQGLDYFIPTEGEVPLNRLPENFSNGYVALVVGANHATKRLTTDMIVALCRLIPFPVLLLGGAGEQDEGERIALDAGSHVWNGCGKYSIAQSASLLRQARIVVTHDTGMMHIAAAFHKIIISIWGNTVPEFGMSPYMPDPRSMIVEVKNLSCRPCSRIGFERCPRKHFRCILQIPLDDIAQTVSELYRSD